MIARHLTFFTIDHQRHRTPLSSTGNHRSQYHPTLPLSHPTHDAVSYLRVTILIPRYLVYQTRLASRQQFRYNYRSVKLQHDIGCMYMDKYTPTSGSFRKREGKKKKREKKRNSEEVFIFEILLLFYNSALMRVYT